MQILEELLCILKKKANPIQAKIYQSFFKTGPGQYGEGDIFWGIKVPELRKIAREYADLNFADLHVLMQSTIHEQRLIALLILLKQSQQALESQLDRFYTFYVKHFQNINNWDLVDLTAPSMVGRYLYKRSKAPLYKWTRSKHLWTRRISMLATFYFIRHNEFDVALRIAKNLIFDQHDLIHKAVGWMLREIGKRNLRVEENFLNTHYKTMPRTMLRYAIERFPESKRQQYLTGRV